jgi:hypothetical protein
MFIKTLKRAQTKGEEMKEETVVATAPDSKTREFFGKILRWLPAFKRFAGTSLEKASAIKGLVIHDIESVCVFMGYNTQAFMEKNHHLTRVPYTEYELTWAARNGFVLTLVSASIRHIARAAGNEVSIPRDLMLVAHIVGVAPKHPQWCLVSRLSQTRVDSKSLKLPKREKDRRLTLAPALTALTAAYLDYSKFRFMPSALGLTASAAGEREGDFSRRILVGRPTQANSFARVATAVVRDGSTYPAILMLKPRKLPVL